MHVESYSIDKFGKEIFLLMTNSSNFHLVQKFTFQKMATATTAWKPESRGNLTCFRWFTEKIRDCVH